ncbi:MAG TPA: hypothetical protein VK421_02180, partial [Pyrinomonadaceae bacterium]|nr:hypothetical protein [Pyrinomonadaceae bacterium]
MPKELIVSVNGREKKIAIIEDGQVTEFYIERGEGGQGIVGNIYKGRVMRVLPGMQSAFVDIGLERDAFLYVSDFFDEEEEFERIVVDRSAKGEDAVEAARAARERIEQQRLERERQLESAQERALPVQAGGEDEEDEEGGEVAEAAAPAPAETGAAEEGRDERRGRGRRGRGRGREESRGGADEAAATGAGEFPSLPPLEQHVQSRLLREEIDTPFASAASQFERVADNDEDAADEGEMFKDARLQERLSDQIRGVEFDMEDEREVEVGSLLGGAGAAGSQFERVADDDEAGVEAPRAVRSVQPAVAASVSSFADELAGETTGAAGGAQAFERVSDDEKAAEGAEARAGRASKKGASKKGAAKKSAAKSPPTKRAAEGDEATEAAAKKSAKKSAAKKSAAKESAAKGGSKKSARKGKATAAGSEAEAEAHANTDFADAEASLSTRGPRGEFARRGGRRRRRPGDKPAGENGGAAGDAAGDGSNGHAEGVEEGFAPEAVVEDVPQAQAEVSPRAEASPRAERAEGGGRRERGGPREGRGDAREG